MSIKALLTILLQDSIYFRVALWEEKPIYEAQMNINSDQSDHPEI